MGVPVSDEWVSRSRRCPGLAVSGLDRQLRRDDAPVELNARYFDALALLVSEPGKLISKDRFLEEVWRGLVVSDEALSQCIKTIRRQLGDSATNPRFIETVPKHGYRFIASITWVDAAAAANVATPSPQLPAGASTPAWRQVLLRSGAGTLGGAIAGILGGLFYGLAGVSSALQSGMGTISVLLVFLCLSIMMGMVGGAGVGFGIAAAGLSPGRNWSILGGAAGGMVIGAFVKMLGLDAFNLLLGQAPGDITGAAEGALLGGAVGCGLWQGSLSAEPLRLRRGIIGAATAGGVAGILTPLLGGRLMGGSLDSLARSFPNSRFSLDHIGAVFGENDFGPISQLVTGGIEGAVFCGCVAGAMLVVQWPPSREGYKHDTDRH